MISLSKRNQNNKRHFPIKDIRLCNFLLISAVQRLNSFIKNKNKEFITIVLSITRYVLFISDYRGVLACLDGYMNIALEQTEEYNGGQLKNKYGDAFIRGNNVLYISTQRKK